MIAFAGMLLAGLTRAKAVGEAHEQFTLTPVLIGVWAGGGRRTSFRSVSCLSCSALLRSRVNACAACLPSAAAVGSQLFLCWLLYYYTASAMRESVLKVNGSNINPW